MMFVSEEQMKINSLYAKLQDLKECKKVLERAMHNNYYNRPVYDKLFAKLKNINIQIKELKMEIIKEKKENEKSGENI